MNSSRERDQGLVLQALGMESWPHGALLDALPGFVWTAGPDGTVDYCNRNWIEYSGLTLDRLRQHGRGLDSVHPEDRERTRNGWKAALAAQTAYTVEHRLAGVRGEYRWFVTRAAPVRGGDGELLGWIGTGTDIHEHKVLEEHLVASEARWRTFAEAIPALVAESTSAGVMTYFNRRWSEFTGITLDELQAFVLQAGHPDDHDRLAEMWAEAVRTGRPMRSEWRVRRADGEYRWHLSFGVPVRDAHGRITSWVGAAIDIDDRKRAEEALVASRAEYRRMLEELPSIAWRVNAWGTVTYVNQRWSDYSGLTIAETTEGKWIEVVHPDDRARTQETWAASIAAGEPWACEQRFRRRDGAYRWHLSRAVPIRDAAGTISSWLCTSTDIEDQKRAQDAVANTERALEQQVSQLETLLDIVPVAIGIAEDPECRHVRVNRELARIARVPHDSNASMTAPLPERRGYKTFRDGYEIDRDELPMVVAARTGRRVLRQQVDIVHEDGTVINMWGDAVPLFDERGRVRGSIGAYLDITELRMVEDDLRRASAVKDEFLGLVSHELKTPITTILGNAEVLEKRLALLSETDRNSALEDIRHEAERLHRIIENLLALARLERSHEAELEPLLVRHIIRGVVEEHRRHHPRREVRVRAERETGPAVASVGYVEQILRNLLSNAEKYSPPALPIDIEVARDGEEIVVGVHDRGPGIDPDEMRNVFTPFYRSPRLAQHVHGVGIGLAVCKRLVDAQAGRIWVTPRAAGGASFFFSLPIAPDDVGTG